MKFRPIALILSLLLLVSCLTGCGSKAEAPAAPAETPAEAPAETDTAEETASPDGGEASAEPEEPFVLDMEKYRAAYAKHAPDDVVMTVNGRDVVWADFFSWVFAVASQIEAMGGFEDWNDDFVYAIGMLENPTYNEYIKYYAYTNSFQMEVVNSQAELASVSLSEESAVLLEETLAQYAEYFGSEEAFVENLSENFIRSEYFTYQNQTVALYNALYEHQFGANGELLPDADAIAFIEDSGYIYAKHILISTVDDSSQPLDDAAVAEKKAEAEAIYAELKACAPSQLSARFDELMHEKTEDPGLIMNPDGYYFHTGEMVPEFEKAALALKENELSEIVETDYGYHILYRPAMSADHIMGYDSSRQPYSMRMLASVNIFNGLVDEWYQSAVVEFSDIYQSFDMNELFA